MSGSQRVKKETTNNKKVAFTLPGLSRKPHSYSYSYKTTLP